MIGAVRRIVTKTNRTMAVAELEDLTGNIDLVAFPDCFDGYGSLFEGDQILDIVAKIDRRNEQLQLICESATIDLSALGEDPIPAKTVHVSLPISADVWGDIRMMQSIDALLSEFEGDDQVVIHLPKGGQRVALMSRKHRVECSDALRSALTRIVSGGEIRIEEPSGLSARHIP